MRGFRRWGQGNFLGSDSLQPDFIGNLIADMFGGPAGSRALQSPFFPGQPKPLFWCRGHCPAWLQSGVDASRQENALISAKPFLSPSRVVHALAADIG